MVIPKPKTMPDSVNKDRCASNIEIADRGSQCQGETAGLEGHEYSIMLQQEAAETTVAKHNATTTTTVEKCPGVLLCSTSRVS